MKKFLAICAIAAMSAGGTQAASVTVNSIDLSHQADGQWFESDVRNNGTASVQSLVGLGGNLENSAPLPTGAALLTTTANLPDKSEVAVTDAYGTVGNIFSSLNLGYSYYKSSVGDLNAAAAPAIKLEIAKTPSAGVGDAGNTFLIFEPYSNQVGNPTPDVWTSVSMDYTSGLFWGTSGFGLTANTAVQTLQSLTTAYNSDFLAAEVLAVSIGVGSWNAGQTGYFDNVTIAHSYGQNGYDVTYDFESEGETIPTPTAGLAGIVGFGIVALARRRRKA